MVSFKIFNLYLTICIIKQFFEYFLSLVAITRNAVKIFDIKILKTFISYREGSNPEPEFFTFNNLVLY